MDKGIAAHFTFLRATGILKEAGGGGPLGAAGGQPVGDEPPASQVTALRARHHRSSTRYFSSVGATAALSGVGDLPALEIALRDLRDVGVLRVGQLRAPGLRHLAEK